MIKEASDAFGYPSLMDDGDKKYILTHLGLSKEETELYMTLEILSNPGHPVEVSYAAAKTQIPEDRAGKLLENLAGRCFARMIGRNPAAYKSVPFDRILREHRDEVYDLDLLGLVARSHATPSPSPYIARIRQMHSNPGIKLTQRQLSILQYLRDMRSEIFPGHVCTESELDHLEDMGCLSSRTSLGKRLYKMTENGMAAFKNTRKWKTLSPNNAFKIFRLDK